MSEKVFILTVGSFFSAISRNSVNYVQYALRRRPELLEAISSGYPHSGPVHAAAVRDH
jgi:hypothetical protein